YLCLGCLEQGGRAPGRREAPPGAPPPRPLLLRLFRGVSGLSGVGRVERIDTRLAIASPVNAQDHAPLALQTDRGIDRDPVQPGEEQRVTLEAVERLIRVEESLLHNVLSVLRVVEQPVHCVVQAVLVTAHQDAEGGRVAFQTRGNQALVVGAHSYLIHFDGEERREFPKHPSATRSRAQSQGSCWLAFRTTLLSR